MQQYPNVVPIWGIQRPEELAQWLELEREGAQMDDELRAFVAGEREELAGSFCRSCGYCMPCTVGIFIRDCARMKLLLRRAPWQQFVTPEWQARMEQINDCIDCGLCASKCPYGLDTPRLLRENLKDYEEFCATHAVPAAE